MSCPRDPIHVAGGICASGPDAIVHALSEIPECWRKWDEVRISAEDYSFSIYPTRQGEYLVGGNIWLDDESARELIDAIGAALDDAGIAFELELSREGQPDELVRGKIPIR